MLPRGLRPSGRAGPLRVRYYGSSDFPLWVVLAAKFWWFAGCSEQLGGWVDRLGPGYFPLGFGR